MLVRGENLLAAGELHPGFCSAMSANILSMRSPVIGMSGDFMYENRDASSLFVPMMRGTGIPRPSRSTVIGASGSRSPSTTGAKARVPGSVTGTSAYTVLPAATTASTGASRSVAGSAASAPRAVRNCWATRAARSRPYTLDTGEDSAMARANRPRAGASPAVS